MVDFIHKRRELWCGPYEWEEVVGNKTDDSRLNFLAFDINLERQLIFLLYVENLDYSEYEIISHSSFDGNSQGCESIDKYIWAAYRFLSSYNLVGFINKMTQIADIIQDDRYYYKQMFRFKESILKSEFESITGIHLFESVIKSNGRW